MSKLTIVCGWCDKKIGEKDGEGIEGESHGICDDCLNRHFPRFADKIRECLDVENIEDIYIPRRKSRIVPETRIHKR